MSPYSFLNAYMYYSSFAVNMLIQLQCLGGNKSISKAAVILIM